MGWSVLFLWEITSPNFIPMACRPQSYWGKKKSSRLMPWNCEGLFKPHMVNRTSYCVLYDNYVQDSSADVSPFKENLPTREEERNYTISFFLEMLLSECIIILHKQHETDKIQGEEGRHQRRQELTPL